MDSHIYHADDRKYKNGPDFNRYHIYKSIPLPQVGTDNFELKSYDPDDDVDKFLSPKRETNLSSFSSISIEIFICVIITILILLLL